MYLLTDFSISEFLPKIKGNERARSIAADLIKEGRKNYRKGKSKGKNLYPISAHDIEHSIPAVSQKYLNTYGNRKNGEPRKVSGIGFTPRNELFVQNKLGKPITLEDTLLDRKNKKSKEKVLKKDPIMDDKDFKKAYSAINQDADKYSITRGEGTGGSLRGYYKGQKPLAGLRRRTDILMSDKERKLNDLLNGF